MEILVQPELQLEALTSLCKRREKSFSFDIPIGGGGESYLLHAMSCIVADAQSTYRSLCQLGNQTHNSSTRPLGYISSQSGDEVFVNKAKKYGP